MCLLIVKLWLDEPTVSADSFGRRQFRPRLIGLSGRLVLVNKKPRKLIINMKMYWLRNRSVLQLCLTEHAQSSQHLRALFQFSLILWRPLLPYGYSYKASCARPVMPSFAIFDIPALWGSKITTDGLHLFFKYIAVTRYDTRRRVYRGM